MLILARPLKCRCICSVPKITCFEPQGQPDRETVNIGYDEYEVIRLLDYEMLSQKQCAEKMSISRSTVARMYEHARKQIADALVNGKKITISGGDIQVCTTMKPECRNVKNCCHRMKNSGMDKRTKEVSQNVISGSILQQDESTIR